MAPENSVVLKDKLYAVILISQILNNVSKLSNLASRSEKRESYKHPHSISLRPPVFKNLSRRMMRANNYIHHHHHYCSNDTIIPNLALQIEKAIRFFALIWTESHNRFYNSIRSPKAKEKHAILSSQSGLACSKTAPRRPYFRLETGYKHDITIGNSVLNLTIFRF